MYDYDDNFTYLTKEELEDNLALDNEVKNLLKQAGYNIDLMDDYGY
ncbi:MAG: hypothetical protein IJI58_00010 [Bacilli bacterium]|nr:hypothetical protein [Bacilli bacterium]